MNPTFTGNKVDIGDDTISFSYPVAELLSTDGIILILLEIPAEVEEPNNIVAVEPSGQILWRIDAPEEGQYEQSYHFLTERNGTIYATNWDGYEYIADTNTGAVRRHKKIDK